VLFDIMADNLGILCFHSGIIISTGNGITCNGENHEFLIATSNMSLNKLLRILYDRLDWNMFEIEVEITWRILQTRVSQARYVDIPICSDMSVDSMFEFVRINRINMSGLYLNSKPIRGNSFGMELTWFSSSS